MIILLALLLASPRTIFSQDAVVKPCPRIERNVVDARFQPGQVWTYETRPGEAGSTLTILEVDRSEKLGVLVHVRVDGLALHIPGGASLPSIAHMPFTRDAMLLSVKRMVRVETTMPPMDGYDDWAKDCGGAYTTSVADAIAAAEKTFNAP